MKGWGVWASGIIQDILPGSEDGGVWGFEDDVSLVGASLDDVSEPEEELGGGVVSLGLDVPGGVVELSGGVVDDGGSSDDGGSASLVSAGGDSEVLVGPVDSVDSVGLVGVADSVGSVDSLGSFGSADVEDVSSAVELESSVADRPSPDSLEVELPSSRLASRRIEVARAGSDSRTASIAWRSDVQTPSRNRLGKYWRRRSWRAVGEADFNMDENLGDSAAASTAPWCSVPPP